MSDTAVFPNPAIRNGRRASQWFAALALMFLAFWGAPAARAAEPAPNAGTARYEIKYMEDMIEHHMMAVHMAMMCVQKATHEELRSLCEEMIATQQAEIALMSSWLESWYGVSHPHHMHDVQPMPDMQQMHEMHAMHQGHHQMMERMAQLSSEEFEIEFLKMMIRHHWQAVVKSATCVDRAYHDELVELCGDIVMMQSREIELMQTWLCDWYGLCHFGPKGARSELAVEE